MENETLNWTLGGIAREKEATAARLEYLQKKEDELRQAGLTGLKASAPKAPKASGKTRKRREISEETRAKMRLAQQKRHASKKTTTAANRMSIAEDVPPSVVPANA